MRLRLFFLFVFFMYANISMGEKMSNDPFESSSAPILSDEEPQSTGSIFSISSNDLPVLIDKANSGDSQASFRLHQYFRFSKRNSEASREWLIKAAEQGHVTGQYNAAVSLMTDGDYSSALFWADKAKIGGHEDADSLVNEINKKFAEQEAKNPSSEK